MIMRYAITMNWNQCLFYRGVEFNNLRTDNFRNFPEFGSQFIFEKD